MTKFWQKTLEMTEAEWDEYMLEIRRDKIQKWNDEGAKGFPPSLGICSISDFIKFAEMAGYELPRQADKILAMPIYRLAREAMIAQIKGESND